LFAPPKSTAYAVFIMSQLSHNNTGEPVSSFNDAEIAENVNAIKTPPVMDAALAERLQLEELSVDDAETAALRLQYAEYADNSQQIWPQSYPASENTLAGSTSADSANASRSESQETGVATAEQLFEAAFPSGHTILPTAGTNLRCGLYAIIKSSDHQYSDRTEQPTIDTLMEVVNSDQYRQAVSRPQIASNEHEAAIMAALAQESPKSPPRPKGKTRATKRRNGETVEEILQNDRYFSPDQLDLLLRFWGEARGLRLRLGYYLANEPRLLGRDQDDGQADVVWIHLRTRGAGHYSGLTVNDGKKKDQNQGGNRGRGSANASKGKGKNRGKNKAKGKGKQTQLAWKNKD
jgi:hypothetical protein